ISTTAATINKGTVTATAFVAENGTADAPSFSFASDPNTGIYLYTADTLVVGVNSTPWYFNTTGFGSNSGNGGFIRRSSSDAAPAFSFVSDQDTGMYEVSANVLGFATNGAERIRIDSGGNVGIGITAPQALLHVGGDSSGSKAIILTTGLTWAGNTSTTIQNPGPAAIFLSSATPGVKAGSVYINSGSNGTGGTFAGDINIWTGLGNSGGGDVIFKYGYYPMCSGAGTCAGSLKDSMFIKGQGNLAGNVGIGTTSPTAALHLKAGSYAAGTAPLKLTSGTNLSATEAGAVEFDGSHLYFTVANSGPRYQLDQQATSGNLTGDVTSVGSVTTLTNAPVIAKVLTGYTSGAGTVSSGDSILQAIQKLNGNDALKAPLASPTFTGSVTMPGTGAWNSSGDAGIGTASPTNKLTVNGAVETSGVGTLTYGHNSNAFFDYMSGNGRIHTFGTTNSTAGGFQILLRSSNMSILNFAFNIDPSGNVGIGTTAPAAKLDVAGSAQFGAGVLKSTFSATPDGTTYALYLSTGLNLAAGGVRWADGTISTTAGSGGGDNLGNHTATQNLNMSTYRLIAADGTGGLPSLTFAGNPDSGFYMNGALNIGVSIDGNTYWNFGQDKFASGAAGGPYLTATGTTAAAPAYSFFTNTNMGMYRPAADNLAFATAGAERLRIDSSGNIGVGTTAPYAKLEISNDSAYSGMGGGQLRISGVTNNNKRIELGYNTTASQGFVQAYTNAGTGDPLLLNPNGGNIGIGTTNPIYAFHLLNNTAGVQAVIQTTSNQNNIRVQSTAGTAILGTWNNAAKAYVGTPDNATFSINTSNTERIVVLAGGSVGIGTTNPGATLEVAGTVKLNQYLTQANDAGVTLTNVDLGKTITVNSATAQTVTLPSGSAGTVGAQITVVKLGAGKVTVTAASGNYIADSASGGTIYCNAVVPAYATITLRLVTATQWMIVAIDGIWVTT
ncbi:MAG: hypothetical protein WCK76_09455, partial [Elusimicrobiota bacterium]